SRFRQYRKITQELEGARDILKDSHDAELRDVAQEEIKELQEKIGILENELKEKLIPQDPQNSKNVIIEIRAGTGGEEAGLFAGDLYRMYSHYAEKMGWKLEILSSSPSDLGGFKEIIFALSGQDVYGTMKFESGVHRVQRVPVTESSGRIHTSASSVAVLPEAEEIDVQIDPKDIKVDVYRSSGPGGQSVNTTDSAVRVTHLPTGMVVTCQDEKSQIKNKAKALKVLRARLFDKMQAEQNAEITAARRAMVSTGDRSAKIRTYNFPQNRITDHRIGLVLYSLGNILDGDLDHLVESLRLAEQTARLGQGVETMVSDE
ncbi:MAG: peptide chain release factor 1, partial [Patescibacteria group bacterium]|nr:peptide chain release factor 1 [Patescibacteria group bacterium]